MHFTIVVQVKRYALPRTDLTAKTFMPLTLVLTILKTKSADNNIKSRVYRFFTPVFTGFNIKNKLLVI